MSRRTGAAVPAAVLLYAAMWIGYLQDWRWLRETDAWFLDLFHRFGAAHPAWVTAWDVFCTVLGPGAFRIVGLGVIIWLLVRRYRRAALFIFATVECSAVVTQVAKSLADRARPDTAMVHAYGTSFPSGHAVGVMVAVLAFLTVLLPMVAVRRRTPLIVTGVVVVLLIGIGRVVLNVHHPSDVLAGWALGFLWYLFCLRLVRPLPLTTAPGGTRAAPDTGT